MRCFVSSEVFETEQNLYQVAADCMEFLGVNHLRGSVLFPCAGVLVFTFALQVDDDVKLFQHVYINGGSVDIVRE